MPIITGTLQDDNILGTNRDDIIYGGRSTHEESSRSEVNGNDTIRGGGGDDRIQGGAEHDILIGGDGHDRLYGGFGNDRLHLSDGDYGAGGPGRDVFRFEGRGNTIAGFDPDEDHVVTRNPLKAYFTNVVGETVGDDFRVDSAVLVDGKHQLRILFYGYGEESDFIIDNRGSLNFDDAFPWGV